MRHSRLTGSGAGPCDGMLQLALGWRSDRKPSYRWQAREQHVRHFLARRPSLRQRAATLARADTDARTSSFPVLLKRLNALIR